MKTSRLLFIFVLLISYQIGISQDTVLYESRFLEVTTEEDKMKIYLDTIDEYLYRDLHLTKKALDECQKIIDSETSLSDSIFFKYLIAQIYFEYNKANPLGAFQKITENKGITENSQLTDAQIGNFNYLKCFTLHSLGDFEAAQKEYYEAIERGRIARDTSNIVRNTYSLGQLFNDVKDYEDAITCFLQVNEYTNKFETRASTCALNNIELAEAYLNLEQYDEALSALKRAEEISNKSDLTILLSDVLMFRGNVYLGQNKIDSAEHIHKQLLLVNEGIKDQNNIFNTQRFLADLYLAKKMYPQALKLQKEIIEDLDSTALDTKIEALEKISKIYQEMNDFEGAYKQVLACNEVKEIRAADEKRQKTAYLKIKYDSEQKERDNAILSAELVKNQAERRLLYIMIVLAGLILIILFGAFYQKARYNKRLEQEVQKRTIKLKASNKLLNTRNKELDEFNRILSHDLKEPLRNIVSFSQLASRDVTDVQKVKEYLNIVTDSGTQLHQLVEDVNIFQNTNTIDITENTMIDIPEILNDIVQRVQQKYPKKVIKLNLGIIPNIIGTADILNPVFLNLIDNAVKYNKERLVLIDISYELKNKMHQFKVEDNGIGVAPDYRDRIFEMFKRLNVRDSYTGSGLGLSIVRKLIEKAGGEISLVQSQEKKGSTFLFSYPFKTEVS